MISRLARFPGVARALPDLESTRRDRRAEQHLHTRNSFGWSCYFLMHNLSLPAARMHGHVSANVSFSLDVDGVLELGAGVHGLAAKLFLDAQDLVELRQTLRPRRRARLDLAGAQADDNVGDGDVLGLAGTVRHHDAPVGAERVLGRLDGLGDGSNLVDLEQQSIASLGLDGLLDVNRVGDRQIIAVSGSAVQASRRRWRLTQQPGAWPS